MEALWRGEAVASGHGRWEEAQGLVDGAVEVGQVFEGVEVGGIDVADFGIAFGGGGGVRG